MKYPYRVNGKEYESERLCVDAPAFHSWVFANAEATKKWVPGTQVPVYCDPKDPSSSVLVPGVYSPRHHND